MIHFNNNFLHKIDKTFHQSSPITTYIASWILATHHARTKHSQQCYRLVTNKETQATERKHKFIKSIDNLILATKNET